MYPREQYLKKIISKKDNGRIKIITGLRRSGKSVLLFQLYLRSGILMWIMRMPFATSLESHEEKSRYLKDLFDRTYIKDVLERHEIKNDTEVLDILLDVLAMFNRPYPLLIRGKKNRR